MAEVELSSDQITQHHGPQSSAQTGGDTFVARRHSSVFGGDKEGHGGA